MCIVVAFHRYLGSDFFIYGGFSQIGFKQTWQYSWWHYRDTPFKRFQNFQEIKFQMMSAYIFYSSELCVAIGLKSVKLEISRIVVNR